MNAARFMVTCLLFSILSGYAQDPRRWGGIIGGGGIDTGAAGSGGFFSEDTVDPVRQSQTEPTILRSYDLSRHQALALFDSQISKMYVKTGTNIVVQTHRWNYYGTSGWKQEKIGPVIRVLQHIEGNKYFAEKLRWHSLRGTYVVDDTGQFAIELFVPKLDGVGCRPFSEEKNKALIPDGKHLLLDDLKNTGNIYSYGSVIGAKASVRLMQGWMESLPISYEEFCMAVINGYSFDVLLPKTIKCPTCKGSGTRAKRHDERGRIGTPRCDACGGKRSVNVEILHRIKK